jgi:hypothetical protein
MNELIRESGPERLLLGRPINLGEWYWIKGSDRDDFGEKGRWLGCVTTIGSNYFEFESIRCDRSSCSRRVHDDELHKLCTYEPKWRDYVQGRVQRHKLEIETALREIQEITKNLGVAEVASLDHQGESRSLSLLNGQVDMKAYKKALIKAKDTTLPELFKRVEHSSEMLASWLGAEAIALKAHLGNMKDGIELINDRIFNVELYAGLTERITVVREGEPAGMADKVHLMQNRLYMDEECLLEYRAGGMTFKNLEAFDTWLAASARFDEMFPYPKCVVSFQVRRRRKEHRGLSEFIQIISAIQEDQLDKSTFLYIRNGGRLYRMRCELEFGEKLFPDLTEFQFGEPMMAKISCNDVERIMPKREWESLREKRRLAVEEHAAWMKANKRTKIKRYTNSEETREVSEHDSPHYWAAHHDHRDLDRYEPFDTTSVYYDDMRDKLASEIKQYNRIVLILQGLLDRSEVLHPHPPAQLYTAEGFERMLVPVYDRDRILHYGEPPDFEEYRAELEKLIAAGSTTIGQDLAWQEHEAKVENARIARSWREKSKDHETFKPYGNPGPGYLAQVVECSKTRATFRWERDRLHRRYRSESETLPDSIAVPRSRLFNVSAYKPGDFKRFFLDPRTRAEYLQWAPFLLAAEDFYAGKTKKAKA